MHISKRMVQLCRRVLFVGMAGLLVSNASASRLGHPAYSASGATLAQDQWNLICDPTDAVSGSTSTKYNPAIAGLNTITAFPGFELKEIDVAMVDDDEMRIERFVLPAGTTTFVVVPPEELGTAMASNGGSTFYATLADENDDADEVGAVQVFWGPLNTVQSVAVKTSTSTKKNAPAPKKTAPAPTTGDVNTHTITFDNVSANPKQSATFTNYANGNSKFPMMFDVPDSYSGPGFTYTANQIAPATATLQLKPVSSTTGDGDNDKDDRGGKNPGKGPGKEPGKSQGR